MIDRVLASADPAGVSVAEGMRVAAGVDVGVAVGIVDGAGVAVALGVAAGFGVAVGAGVGVAVGIVDGAGVAVALGVAVGFGVAVGAGVGVIADLGVTLSEAADAAPVPALFVAFTVKVYATPLVSPVTVIGLNAPVPVRPPGLAVTL